jgi:ribosomal protein L27
MKTTPFKFDDLHNVQLSQDAAPSDGRPIQAPAGFGIRRMHPGHVRSGSRMKMAFPFALVLLLGSSLALHAATRVTNIAAGEDYSLFIKSDGSLWGVGDNSDGELGDGTNVLVDVPVEIVSNNVVLVAAGEAHSLFVKSDGSLWGMDYNGNGELGDGTTNNVSIPEEIVSNNVVAVAAGADHSLFLKSDGSLWGMGFQVPKAERKKRSQSRCQRS